MRAIPIRIRLTLWYFFALLAGLLVFGVGTWLALEHRLISNVDERLEQRVRGLQAALNESDADVDDASGLAEDIEEFKNALADNTVIEIRASDGALVFPPHDKVFRGDGQGLRTLHRTFERQGQHYDATVGLPTTDVQTIMHDFRSLLFLIIPFVVIVAAVGGYCLSRTALRPVDEITNAAKSITVENLSRRLVVPNTNDELQRMSETWNQVLERLDSAVQRIKQFTADASHELRTPVALIRATAELALTSERERGYYKESLRTIEQEAARMTELMESLLTLARMDSYSVESLQPTDMNQLLHNVVTLNRSSAESKGITLELTLPRSPVVALADEDGIRRLLLILLDNALKQTPAGGQLTVSATVEQNVLTTSVRDTGKGISAADIPHIFERFYRVDKSRSSEGVGLGLSIAQRIAQLHGSEIQVESAVGRGSCFSFRLAVHTGQTFPFSR
jgi:two-component system heavy metal sensor histidine kinase CusS